MQSEQEKPSGCFARAVGPDRAIGRGLSGASVAQRASLFPEDSEVPKQMWRTVSGQDEGCALGARGQEGYVAEQAQSENKLQGAD